MSAAVMPSSLYDFSDISFSVLKHQTHDSSKHGWESGSDGDSGSGRSPQLIPSSIMTTFLMDLNHHRRIERTQSEPTKAPALNVNTSRYKTELCRPYEESGSCKYGEKCQFAHGGHELRCLVRHPKYKTEFCRTFHSVGFCPYGPRCHFIHNEDEARGSKPRPRPLSLPSGSDSASSSSPSSLGSASPPPPFATNSYTSGSSSSPPNSPPPPPASPESRLPVFNRISAPNTPTPLIMGLPQHALNMRFGGELIV